MLYILFASLAVAPEAAFLLAAKLEGVSLGSVALAVACISIGGTIGSSLIYLIARLIGLERGERLLRRRPFAYLCNGSELQRVSRLYDRRGHLLIFFGRWVPTFRSLVSIPAGLTRMPAGRFVSLTLLGTLSWNTILGAFVFVMGQSANRLESWAESYTLLSITALGLLALYCLANRLGGNLNGTDRERK